MVLNQTRRKAFMVTLVVLTNGAVFSEYSQLKWEARFSLAEKHKQGAGTLN